MDEIYSFCFEIKLYDSCFVNLSKLDYKLNCLA